MTTHAEVTLQLPEALYLRLQQTAQATQQSLEAVMLRALQVGSPPAWDGVPAAFQAELAALDRLDDTALWQLARARTTAAEMERYQTLLDKHANGELTAPEQTELATLRATLDLEMLRKAQAAALLQWRGHRIPPADAL